MQVSAIISVATCKGLASGVTSHAFNVGDVLPAGARFLGGTIGEGTFVAFDDATHATYNIEIGDASGVGGILGDRNITTGFAVTMPYPTLANGGLQGLPGAPLSGQIRATIHSTVDLNTITAGTIKVVIFFFLP